MRVHGRPLGHKERGRGYGPWSAGGWIPWGWSPFGPRGLRRRRYLRCCAAHIGSFTLHLGEGANDDGC